MSHYDDADILLAPLELSYFNQRKSALKIIEAGCASIPIICSNISPYKEFLTEGVFLCNNNTEWFNTIKLLVEDENLRKDSGLALADYVRRNYHLKDINNRREEWLRINL